MERKKILSGCNRTILIHSNVSNRTISIHSNVSKFFKKQNINTLYCFANRHTQDQNSYNLDEVISKESRSYNIYWEIVPLNHCRGTVKKVGQDKSRLHFQELQVKSRFLAWIYFHNWKKTKKTKNFSSLEKRKKSIKRQNESLRGFMQN